jgi:regulator of sirC expression with transglutaminase-like and TPR domain
MTKGRKGLGIGMRCWIDLPLIVLGTALTIAAESGIAATSAHTPGPSSKPSDASASLISPALDSNLGIVRSLLQQPEDQIDLARAKLAIDRLVDPSVDVNGSMAIIEAMAATENRLIPLGTSVFTKMQTLRQYLYEVGPWNNNMVFHYDFDDPKGNKLENKLLSHYLATRKGQCVSMPILFLAVAQRMGMDVALALAPNHSFVMLRGDDGQWLNLETTGTGAPTKIETYQRQFPMSPASLEQGAYMRPLMKKEAVASMVEELLQQYDEQHRYEQEIALADLALRYHPKNVGILLFRSYAYEEIVRRDFIAFYPTAKDIPTNLRPRYKAFATEAVASRKQAIALGALPVNAQREASYQDNIDRAKAEMSKGATP